MSDEIDLAFAFDFAMLRLRLNLDYCNRTRHLRENRNGKFEKRKTESSKSDSQKESIPGKKELKEDTSVPLYRKKVSVNVIAQ